MQHIDIRASVEAVQFWENMNKLDGADLTLDSIRAQQELYNSPTTYIQSERECEEVILCWDKCANNFGHKFLFNKNANLTRT